MGFFIFRFFHVFIRNFVKELTQYIDPIHVLHLLCLLCILRLYQLNHDSNSELSENLLKRVGSERVNLKGSLHRHHHISYYYLYFTDCSTKARRTRRSACASLQPWRQGQNCTWKSQPSRIREKGLELVNSTKIVFNSLNNKIVSKV